MPSSYRKKLIEVALPLEAINEASVRESYIYKGNPSSLHKWWAQRSLAASRAVIFASMVDDPDDPNASPDFVEVCKKLPRGKNAAEEDTPRQRLFDFIENLISWEASTDEKVISKAKMLIRLSVGEDLPPFLDPFAGGGTIPVEAQRLGFEITANDLNPIAVILNQALLVVPQRFINLPPISITNRSEFTLSSDWKLVSGLAEDVLYYGDLVYKRAEQLLGKYYPFGPNGDKVLAWLWARTVKCPNPVCGAEIPLVTSFLLGSKSSNRAWIKPIIDKEKKDYRFEVVRGSGQVPKATKIGRGAKFSCLVCDKTPSEAYIKQQGIDGIIGKRLLAIVTIGPQGRQYHSPTNEHQNFGVPQPEWKPKGEIVDDPRAFTCKLYGFNEFIDLFNERQLFFLTQLINITNNLFQQIESDAIKAGLKDDGVHLKDGGKGAKAYAEAILLYLAFAYDKYAMYGNSFVTWYGKEDRPSMLFTRQAIPMVWDYTEVNPFSGVGGSYIRCVEIISESLRNIVKGNEGIVHQLSATDINSPTNALISTDPPYYDNVPYADLSDFFYVWLRFTLKDYFPDLFGTILSPKDAEIVAAPYRHEDSEAADKHFVVNLEKAFLKIRDLQHESFPVTIYYAFRETEMKTLDAKYSSQREKMSASTGWETMLEGLLNSHFLITGTWPIRTERKGRVRDSDSNALASSIVLVCRPLADDSAMISRREFVNMLRQELPVALREMQTGNIAPVDLAQASIGPGMAVYSRYSKVLEPDGSPLTVRTALQIINHELDAYLAEQEGEMDADSRFAIAWFEQFGFKEGGFGQADVLARAKNTSVEGLARAGVLDAEAGKVRLLHWSDLDPDWDPEKDKRLTVWEIVHHLIESLSTHGEEGAAKILAQLSPDQAADARQLAYRLYSICERKSWAEHARDYNALAVSWGASQEQARGLKDKYRQEQLL